MIAARRMLAQLSVKNVALVDRVELDLEEGLTVLTGETGAGKSVLVQSLTLLLGGRASGDLIRSGADEAVVEGLFSVSPGSTLAERLNRRGIEAPDGELLVRRTVSGKRGRIFLNGQLGTAAMLREILRSQLDVTGQHEHVTLLDPDVHLSLLDRWAGLEAEVDRVGELHRRVQGYRTMLADLELDEGQKAQREDYLVFALDEIRAADPQSGELETLEERRGRLRHAEALAQGLTEAEAILYSSDGAVVELLGRVERTLRRSLEFDPSLSDEVEEAESVRVRVEELARGIDRAKDRVESDPASLDSIEARLDVLRRLVRKYGGTVDSVLQAKAAMEEELDRFEHEEFRRADLLAALEAETQELDAACSTLRKAREEGADALQRALQVELEDLALPDARIRFRLTALAEPGSRGSELAEIEITPNRGEEPRPLRRIASGGELSRVLLAFKRALADRVPAQSYVFDEIDTGIGGAVAEVLGRKLRDVSRHGQVICVTHLPQIAAQADVHYVVEKAPGGAKRRVLTTLRRLSAEERVEELARMLGGVQITDKVRSAAAEMLHRAGPTRGPSARRRSRGGRSIR